MKFTKLLSFLSVGALAIAAVRAEDPNPEPEEVICSGCLSGVGIWNHVMVIQTSTGTCTTNQVMWRRDGICKEVYDSNGEVYKCNELPCQYILDPGCTGDSCDELLAGAYDNVGNFFSFDGCGLYIFGAPWCGWYAQITQFAFDPVTWSIQTRANWLYCGPCAIEVPPVEPPAGG